MDEDNTSTSWKPAQVLYTETIMLSTHRRFIKQIKRTGSALAAAGAAAHANLFAAANVKTEVDERRIEPRQVAKSDGLKLDLL
jgi:hypothetical protein